MTWYDVAARMREAAAERPFPWSEWLTGAILVAILGIIISIFIGGNVESKTWKVSTLIGLFLLLALVASGCTSPIVKGGSGITVSSTSTVGKDLLGAEQNFDNAVNIGVLPATDPAVLCLHDVLKQVGLEQPACVAPVPPATTPVCPAAAASFVPVNAGAISAGSILYIQSIQLGGISTASITTDCKAVVGGLVIDGLALTNKVGLNAILFGLK